MHVYLFFIVFVKSISMMSRVGQDFCNRPKRLVCMWVGLFGLHMSLGLSRTVMS